VITGTGALTSIASGSRNFFNQALNGTTSVELIPDHWNQYADYSSGIWSPLLSVDYTACGLTDIEIKQMDRAAQMAVYCSFEAIGSAGLSLTQTDKKKNSYAINGIDPSRSGVFIGTGIGGVYSLTESFTHQIHQRTKAMLLETAAKYPEAASDIHLALSRMIHARRFNPFSVSMIMQNSSAGHIGVKFGFTGSNITLSLACASGTAAIGYAFQAIRNGTLDRALCGGVEFMHDEYGGLYYGFDLLKTLAKKKEPLSRSYQPFDTDRSGFLYSEGGCGILMIEDLDTALSRNAPVLAEITGYAETCDASNIIMLEPSGRQIERMLDLLFKDSQTRPGEVQYINAHGTGTVLNDEVESSVIDRVFGQNVWINSTKSLIGHTLGASGALEAIMTAFSIKEGMLHPTANLSHPLKPLNFVREPRKAVIDNAVSQSFGFGGHNTALMIRKFRE
jgi:3-oxoacyl-[acyl-carrier-protein] synthase II